jgi:hypothetical protein
MAKVTFVKEKIGSESLLEVTVEIPSTDPTDSGFDIAIYVVNKTDDLNEFISELQHLVDFMSHHRNCNMEIAIKK